MSPAPLRSARLVLVAADEPTARAVVEGRPTGRPQAAGWPTSDTRDGMLGGLAAAHALPAEAAPAPYGWLVALADSGLVIGDLGTKGWLGPQGEVEIGYGLAAEYRGRGLGREAVGTLLDWLWTFPACRSVLAEVAVGNLASGRLLESQGFRLDPHQRTDPAYLWYRLDRAGV